MADYMITITVDKGKLSVDEPLLPVYPEETVSWYCDTNAYAVLFSGDTPFKNGKYFFAAQAGVETGAGTGKALDGGIDAFKYTIAVYVGGTKPILMLDPHIIIDDTGGGGGLKKKKKARRKSTRKKAKKRN